MRWRDLSPRARWRVWHRLAVQGGDWMERAKHDGITLAVIIAVGFLLVGVPVATFTAMQSFGIYWIALPVTAGWVLIVFGIYYITRRKT